MTNTQKKMIHGTIFIPLLSVILFSGCHSSSCPRLRNSDYFGAPSGIRLPDPNNLGQHSMEPSPHEKLGFVYTCKGGFIDLGHLRESADRTYYAAGVINDAIVRSKNKCSFKIIEPSRYYLTIDYPDNWEDLSAEEKQAIANDVAVQYGQYIGHTSLIWHEILTWYNYSSSGLFSENISSFSIEDPYSDVLGTCLGVRAMSDPNQPYEETMTNLINETLAELGVQPPDVCKEALHKVKGRWYVGGGYFFVEMKKRNFDVGLDDGLVTPWLVPGVCSETVATDCPAPNPSSALDAYGFKMRLEIEVMALQKNQIYQALNLKCTERINPQTHFPKVIKQITIEAKKLEGDDVDKNTWPDTAAKQNAHKTTGATK